MEGEGCWERIERVEVGGGGGEEPFVHLNVKSVRVAQQSCILILYRF